MDNWAETIKGRFEQHQKEIEQIETTLDRLVAEIQKTGLGASRTREPSDSLNWNVHIMNLSRTIGLSEIRRGRKANVFDKFGNATKNRELSYDEVLKNLILEKFNWEL